MVTKPRRAKIATDEFRASLARDLARIRELLTELKNLHEEAIRLRDETRMRAGGSGGSGGITLTPLEAEAVRHLFDQEQRRARRESQPSLLRRLCGGF